MPYKVVFTDYYYPTLDEERQIFAGTHIEIVDGNGRLSGEIELLARDGGGARTIRDGAPSSEILQTGGLPPRVLIAGVRRQVAGAGPGERCPLLEWLQ